MSDKLQRTIARFQAKIDSGSFYEAHQTLRTIANRYVHLKQYSEAADLLYQGANILAKNKEYASASDLTSYLLLVYNDAAISSADKDRKLKLIELLLLFPDDEASLLDLSKQSIEWSQSEANKYGDAELHTFFGTKFLRGLEGSSVKKEEGDKLYAFAELHLILGTRDALSPYVAYLRDWYHKAQQEDADVDAGIFLSRAVINYAYLRNIKFAEEAIDIFVEDLGTAEVVEGVKFYPKHSLVNFLQLLVATLRLTGESSSKFLKLHAQYKLLLNEHKLLGPVEYLGFAYFGLKLGNPNNQQNMLANLMGGLFK